MAATLPPRLPSGGVTPQRAPARHPSTGSRLRMGGGFAASSGETNGPKIINDAQVGGREEASDPPGKRPRPSLHPLAIRCAPAEEESITPRGFDTGRKPEPLHVPERETTVATRFRSRPQRPAPARRRNDRVAISRPSKRKIPDLTMNGQISFSFSVGVELFPATVPPG